MTLSDLCSNIIFWLGSFSFVPWSDLLNHWTNFSLEGFWIMHTMKSVCEACLSWVILKCRDMYTNYDVRFNRKTAPRNSLIVWGMRVRQVLIVWSRKMLVEGNARFDLHIFLLTIFLISLSSSFCISDSYILYRNFWHTNNKNMYQSYYFIQHLMRYHYLSLPTYCAVVYCNISWYLFELLLY